MSTWDCSYDFVSVGSGGGGLVGALRAADAGCSSLVLEKQSLVGGSTAMSGGMVWIPNNPLLSEDGVPDSYDDGMAYFASAVGEAGPGSSQRRRHAYLTDGPRMVSFLRDSGMRFTRCAGYPDYYDNVEGGKAEGRSIEGVPHDARGLGEWRERLQPGLASSVGFPAMTEEIPFLMHFNRSWRSLGIAIRIAARGVLAKIRRRPLLTNGSSLIGQMVEIAVARGIPIWLDTSVQELVVEGGRVTGVRVTRDGATVSVQARKGVLLAAGGFARNEEMRLEHGAEQRTTGEWSMSNPGDTGEVLATAMALGAQTDLLDEAWWLPNPSEYFAMSALNSARQRAHTIYVDAAGERFCNEANSYVEVGKAMFARNKRSSAVPCWLVFDDNYRRRYAHSQTSVGRLPAKWLASGEIKKAATLAELARSCGIDEEGLARTVARFNEHAAHGRDPVYGRGESQYNRHLGDPGHKPNPALGPLDRSPFYALPIFPSDVGTCGGLVTDEHARVLGADGECLPGLYATGNITATVMGRTYLGAGGSIGNTMVFGFAAAEHACGAVPSAAGR
ncbi:FAD-binding protein [Saccharopolyspora sp. HNM0983]|uniref:3-oxosteroid 1-dehydrogenase n=1 Tax=Saccharopolyspora montiporae TaxID=2781240 RepID=A0A929B6R0_9PSEU|nr:FAD-binding protein [Saccharopolyspora sp. HNM0983]MBE9373276.1 FAD-binding protein [Saccharopolyspora sp. HNM0983]